MTDQIEAIMAKAQHIGEVLLQDRIQAGEPPDIDPKRQLDSLRVWLTEYLVTCGLDRINPVSCLDSLMDYVYELVEAYYPKRMEDALWLTHEAELKTNEFHMLLEHALGLSTPEGVLQARLRGDYAIESQYSVLRPEPQAAPSGSVVNFPLKRNS